MLRVPRLRLWGARFLVWAAAIVVGWLAVLFAELAEAAVAAFREMRAHGWWWPLILCPVGGALVVWITRRWFAGAEGSGIPQAIAEIALREPPAGWRPLLSLRIAAGKILLGAAALLAGFSTGREGPTVQVGAAVMASISRFVPRLVIDRRHLIAAGGAAGIAAAFNTPLAGIMFAIEELNRGLENRLSGLLIVAIVLAGVVSQALLGSGNYFGWVSFTGLKSFRDLVWVAPLGVLCGLAGAAFARLMLAAGDPQGPVFSTFRRRHPIQYAAACGAIIALVGLLSEGTAHGTGYLEARELFERRADLPWHYALDKAIATAVSFASGVPGGIFAPTLAIGAGLGDELAPFFADHLAAGTVLILSTCGFLAAVTQAPITAFVIVMEMVSGYGLVLDLMFVALVASGVSRTLCPPFYRTLANRLLAALSSGRS